MPPDEAAQDLSITTSETKRLPAPDFRPISMIISSPLGQTKPHLTTHDDSPILLRSPFRQGPFRPDACLLVFPPQFQGDGYKIDCKHHRTYGVLLFAPQGWKFHRTCYRSCFGRMLRRADLRGGISHNVTHHAYQSVFSPRFLTTEPIQGLFRFYSAGKNLSPAPP